MGVFKFLKPPSHQQFSYKPRYWNPKKEEAEQRNARIEQLQNGGIDAMKTRISGGFRKGAGGAAAGTYRNQRVKRSNGTLFLVIIGLLVVSYFAIEVYFPDFSGWLNTELPQAPAEAPPVDNAPTMEVEEL
ncbi:hypothetical protein [Neolewinella antarctica]|uniref:Stress-associated endoplasmic reticulum protein n=1 Tax=Neolewinella antarctica TaxID=442734 RepID=A0ABX0XDG0_9BACT|nr:hypothetical protein [Neolewinella antarctica]NJC27247.1 hypothetical protein [Neolewinella antarctica]